MKFLTFLLVLYLTAVPVTEEHHTNHFTQSSPSTIYCIPVHTAPLTALFQIADYYHYKVKYIPLND